MSHHPGVLYSITPRGTVALYNSTLDGRDIKDSALDGTVIRYENQLDGMSEKRKPGPKPSVTDEELLQLFRETGDPVLSTAEVAEQVTLARRSVYDRLKALHEEGRLEAKEIGGRNTVWWVPDEPGG